MKVEEGTGALYASPRHVRAGLLALEELIEGARPGPASVKAALKPGDVLINLRGDENATAVVPLISDDGPVYVTLDVGVIRPDRDRVDPHYLAAWLGLPATQASLSADREGSRVPRLSLRALSELAVPLPPLERQRRFGALHTEVVRERALRNQIAEARERLLHELLRRSAEEPAPGM